VPATQDVEQRKGVLLKSNNLDLYDFQSPQQFGLKTPLDVLRFRLDNPHQPLEKLNNPSMI
jgi:hypothetical protein